MGYCILMKSLLMILKYFIPIVLFSLAACIKTVDVPVDADDSTITGTWILTEAYISAGGPQYWVDVEDGETIRLSEDGTFTSDRFTDCDTGDFSVQEDELTLEYACEEFESVSQNEEGLITYRLELFSDYFLLTPTSGPICVEGCSYKYERQ